MRIFLKIWTIIALSFFPINLYSQTEIAGGEVSGVWTKANSPYRINGDINIPNGKTLEIKPGVVIEFQGSYLLYVKGSLLVIGNEIDSINIKSRKSSILWKGIEIINNDNKTIIDYCNIKNCESKDWNLFICGNSVLISNSRFFDNKSEWAIVWINGCKNTIFKNNSIFNNKGKAIEIKESTPKIENNFIHNNSIGIGCHSFANPIIINNIIVNNESEGIGYSQSCKPLIINNIIAYNGGYGVSVENSYVYLINSIIWKNNPSSGDQILLREASDNSVKDFYSSYQISNCLIENDRKGIISNWLNEIDINSFTSLVEGDPQFINPPLETGIKFNGISANWSFLSSSPCINSGIIDTSYLNLPLTDFNCNPRISDGRIDIGAIEFQNVSGDLLSDFKVSVSKSNVPPLTAQFTDLSKGSPDSWEWDFGDGAISTIKNPIHEYLESGKYTVSLTIRKGKNLYTNTKINLVQIGESFLDIREKEVFGIWDVDVVYINQEITIPNGKTLEIKPNVNVLFRGPYRLNVEGRLLALGKEGDSIHFNSCKNGVHWNGIFFTNVSYQNDSSKIMYCDFENVYTRGWGFHQGVFNCRGSSKLLISDSKFENNRGDCIIYLIYGPSARIQFNSFNYNTVNQCCISINSGQTNPFIHQNRFLYNSSKAIYCEQSFGRLTNNLICNNLDGISLDMSSPLIVNNIICNNKNDGIFSNYSDYQAFNNTICNNGRDGISCANLSNPYLINNIIDGNKRYPVYIEDNSSNPVISNCNIEGGLNNIGGPGGGINYSTQYFNNNVYTEPSFENPTSGSGTDFDAAQAKWLLKSNSSCINSGINDTSGLSIPISDISGNERISNGRIDIGAIEFSQKSILKAGFNADITNGNEDSLVVQFNNTSFGDIKSWIWDFGDGHIISEQNPVHIYKEPGIYNVSLKIKDNQNEENITHLNYISLSAIIAKGTVSGTWQSKFVKIIGDILIPDNETLIINPGTKIEFNGHYKIDVQGRLIAKGNINDSIYFTTTEPWIKWKGIRINNYSDRNDTTILSYCILENGKVTGIWPENSGGAISISGKYSKLSLTNSKIMNNVAVIGGAIYCNASNPTIINNILQYNLSMEDAGAIAIHQDASPKIINNLIISNKGEGTILFQDTPESAILIGNLIANNESTVLGVGAIKCVGKANPGIVNNTIVHNEAHNGGGIDLRDDSSPLISNNIIYGNLADLKGNQINIRQKSCFPKIFFNNIQGGFESITGEGAGNNFDQSNYKNNIDSDPKFIKNTIGTGLEYDVLDADWSISLTSPCVNAGSSDTTGLNLPPTDFAGNPRIASGRIDIGAYEYQPDNDLSITAWLSKTKSCKFTDNETIKIRIKNYGLKSQSNFIVYYSMNEGVSYIAENVLSTIKSGDSLDYSFKGTADFKSIRTYHCITFVSSQGDYFLTNDTLKVDVVSYSLSTGLNAKYDFCEGITDTIKVDPGMTSYQWTGEVSFTNYLTVSKSGSYSVKVTNDEGCVAEENTNVTFHLPPAAPSGTDKLTCEGALAASLTAIGTNIKWYNDSKLNKLIAEGNSYYPNINKQGIYPFYITQTEPVYGCTSPASTIKLTINPRPSSPLAEDVYIGLGDAAKSLTASGTNIQWYSKPDGTGLLYNGDTYNPTKTSLGTYEYYVTQTMDGCESQPEKVSLYILDTPAPPKTVDKTICMGRGDSKLQADGVNVKWYSNKDLTKQIGTGPEFDTGETKAGTYIYYINQTVNNVIGATGTIILTIIDVPYAPEVENVTIFKGEDPRPLTATGQSVKWYTDEALTNKVFEGSEFSTNQTNAGTYNYYVTQTVNGCESPARLVEYTLTETLNQIFTSVCEGDESIIEAPGQNVKWYADEARTNLLASGNKFSTGKTTPGDYTFYYTQTVNNTESNPARAVLTIHPIPPKPEIMETGSSFCYEDIVKCTNYDKQYSYNWYLDETPIAGETNSEYVLKKDLKGTLKLVVTDLNTKCLNSSKEFSVSSFIPEIVLKGDNILICKNLTNDYKAWQWFRDNQKIENATYQFYEAKQPGEYFTEATNTIDCVMKSNKISTLQTFTVNLYPTINNGNFNLEIQNAKAEQVNLKVYNIFGLKINEMEIEMMAEKTVIPISLKGIQPGIYMIEMTFGNNRFMRRMVVE